MPPLKNPLFSLTASGRLTRAFTLARRLSGPGWLLRGRPADPKTEPQLSWRTMWQLAAGLWHDLDASEQDEWERDATPRHMTGYAWYMSQALRPNPGIYLPLAGGTMSGDIDTDGNRVTGLVDPTLAHHAARKAYVDAEILAAKLGQGARARRTTDQNIAHSTTATLSFDMTDFDNDGMWEGVTNPTRLTIQTAGIYLVTGAVHFSGHPAGYRSSLIRRTGVTLIAQAMMHLNPPGNVARGQVTTLCDCPAGGYWELEAFQTSGVQLQLQAHGLQAPVLQAIRVGE